MRAQPLPQLLPEASGVAKCHIEGCERDASSGIPVCEVCRLSYLNGYNDAVIENNGRRAPWTLPKLCSACGHFVHEGSRCAWHGGSCDDACADRRLWCQCDGKHPLGRMEAHF